MLFTFYLVLAFLAGFFLALYLLYVSAPYLSGKSGEFGKGPTRPLSEAQKTQRKRKAKNIRR